MFNKLSAGTGQFLDRFNFRMPTEGDSGIPWDRRNQVKGLLEVYRYNAGGVPRIGVNGKSKRQFICMSLLFFSVACIVHPRTVLATPNGPTCCLCNQSN